MSTVCALPAIANGSTGDFFFWRWGSHSASWMLFLHKREAPFVCYSQTFVSDAEKAKTEARLMQVGLIPLPPSYFEGQKGGPTEDHPNRPYCKPDQSCCDFACGN